MQLREIVVGREEFKKEKNERTDGRAGAGPKSESGRVMGRSRKTIINLRRKKHSGFVIYADMPVTLCCAPLLRLHSGGLFTV